MLVFLGPYNLVSSQGGVRLDKRVDSTCELDIYSPITSKPWGAIPSIGSDLSNGYPLEEGGGSRAVIRPSKNTYSVLLLKYKISITAVRTFSIFGPLF